MAATGATGAGAAGAISTARVALQTVGAEQVDRVAELEARRLELMREKAEIVKAQKLEARKRKLVDKKIQGTPTDNLLRMVGARLASEAKAVAKAKPRARARPKSFASGVSHLPHAAARRDYPAEPHPPPIEPPLPHATALQDCQRPEVQLAAVAEPEDFETIAEPND